MSKFFDPEPSENKLAASNPLSEAEIPVTAATTDSLTQLDSLADLDGNKLSTEQLLITREPVQGFNGGWAGREVMLISLANILTYILGLLREGVLAALFTTSAFMQAFVIADNTLSIIFNLVANGAISVALVPVLSRYAANSRDRREFWKIVNTLLTLGTILLFIVIGILELFAVPLVHFMSAKSDAYIQGLTVDLVRVILLAIFFLGISSIVIAALEATQQFARSAFSMLAYNGSVVLVALVFGVWLQVWSVVIGVLLGSFILIMLQVPGLHGNRFKASFDFRHPALKEIWRLYRPIFLGLLITSATLIIDRNLANSIGDSTIGAMRYAFTIQQFILSLIGAGISIAILPALSQQAKELDLTNYRNAIISGLRLLAVFIIPATFSLLALALPVISLIYQHGKFDEEAKQLTLIALLGYLPGIPATAFAQMLLVAFYLRRHTLTPVLVGFMSNLVYLVLAWLLVKFLEWGLIGLVLANSAQQIVQMSILLLLLRRWFDKHTTKDAGSLLWPTLCKTVVAALLMAASAFLVSNLIALKFGNSMPATLMALLAGIGGGAGVYLVCLKVLKVEELRQICGTLRLKLKHWLREAFPFN